MKPSEDSAEPVESTSSGENESTSLPVLRTWRSGYLFVFSSFILWVLLLLALTMSYS